MTNVKSPGATPGHRSNDGGYVGGNSLGRQLQDYRLTTAQILYHLPDHPNVLQTYVWQELDIAPRFPILNQFLTFWTRELEGKLHSVRVASASLISPGTWQNRETVLTLQ